MKFCIPNLPQNKVKKAFEKNRGKRIIVNVGDEE